jgi:hypothetical protein
LSVDPRAPLYSIHGLIVESEIPLDARRIGAENARSHGPDYQVIEGESRDVPYEPPPGRVLGEFPVLGYWVSENEAGLWTVRHTGMCEVILDRERGRIEIHRSPECDRDLLPLIVEGSGLAHALMAEERLVLQASAVETDGSAMAIAGPPRGGKSTLAALLCAAGARLVTDDALRVDRSVDGAVCFPGTNRIRLTRNAAVLGKEIRGADLRATADGRTSVLPPGAADSPLELASVLIPSPTGETRELEVERLRGTDALVELMRHPRLGGWRAAEPVRRLFELTAGLAESVAVFRATVPWGPPFQPDLAASLLAALGLGAAEDLERAGG